MPTEALPQHGLVFALCGTFMLWFFHPRTLCSAALTLSLPAVPGKISDRDSTFPREEENEQTVGGRGARPQGACPLGASEDEEVSLFAFSPLCARLSLCVEALSCIHLMKYQKGFNTVRGSVLLKVWSLPPSRITEQPNDIYPGPSPIWHFGHSPLPLLLHLCSDQPAFHRALLHEKEQQNKTEKFA